MSEYSAQAARRSPFDGQATGPRPNADGAIGVLLHADTLPGVLQLSTWISGVAGLEQALTAWFGMAPPSACGQTLNTPRGLLLRTGPEEFLLLADTPAADPVAEARRHVGSDTGAVTDLGHARCRIRVSGVQSRATLSKLFPIDLREPAFPVGQVQLTGHHHVPCAIHRLGPERFDLIVFTTYAFDQLAAVIDAALEYGVELQAEPSTSTRQS